MKTALGLDKTSSLIYKRDGNTIYVCFALDSMVRAVEEWYDQNFKYDRWGFTKKAHIFHLIRFYDNSRFSNHATIGEEREKYLDEVDMYVQMRRDD